MITQKRALEWLSSLPIEEMRVINRQYEEYAQGRSAIFRMGKTEWMMNKYGQAIEQNSKNPTKNEAVGREDTKSSKAEAEKKETEEKQEVEETRDEDIQTPQTEAQGKVKGLKIALALLSAGAIWMLI